MKECIDLIINCSASEFVAGVICGVVVLKALIEIFFSENE